MGSQWLQVGELALLPKGEKPPGTNGPLDRLKQNVTFSPAVREQMYLTVMSVHSTGMGKHEKIVLLKKKKKNK